MKTLFLALLLTAVPVSADTSATTPTSSSSSSSTPRAMIGGDEMVMVGEIAVLKAEDSENAHRYQWILRPKPVSMKKADKLGSSLYVSHNVDEVFEVELTVSSPDGELSVVIGTLEVRGTVAAPTMPQGPAMGDVSISNQQEEKRGPTVSDLVVAIHQFRELQDALNPPPRTHTVSAANMTAAGMMGYPVQKPENAVEWPELVRRLASKVSSKTRSAEAIAIAGSFRTVANRIKTGTFSGKDPWMEAFTQSKEALGSAWTPWGTFFTDMAKFIGGAKGQGLFNTPQDSLPYLEAAADVLAKL